MVRVALLVLAALVGSTVLKKRCDCCGEKWRQLGECPLCSRHVCSGCGTPVYPVSFDGIELTSFAGTCCAEHLAEYNEEIERLQMAAMSSDYVKVYSKNYRGKAPEARFGQVIETESPVKDKAEAERRLRYLAALEGAEYITEFDFIRHTDQDGNYKYATWTAAGVI